MHSRNISEYLFPRKIGGGFADGSSAECRAVPIGSTLLSPLYHVATQVPPLQNAATAELLMAFHILKPVSTYPYFEWKCNYTRARRAHPPFLLIRFFLSLSLFPLPPSLSLPTEHFRREFFFPRNASLSSRNRLELAESKSYFVVKRVAEVGPSRMRIYAMRRRNRGGEGSVETRLETSKEIVEVL